MRPGSSVCPDRSRGPLSRLGVRRGRRSMSIISEFLMGNGPHGWLLDDARFQNGDGRRRGPIRVVGLNCSLKHSGQPSSTQAMLSDVVREMLRHGKVEYEAVRVADYDIKSGVSEDEGDGDEWPIIAAKILE